MDYREAYRAWCESPALTDEEHAALAALDEKEIEESFFSLLRFGTAGLRSTVGLGPRRMNVYVIRHATQAFAQVILAEGADAVRRGVAICFDCRVDSARFAREAACVMAANGIPVRLFDAMRPTPELSFAVRHHGCIAGLNVTASHNPPEYNGYKVYWSDGAQLPPQHAAAVAAQMERLDIFRDVKTLPYEDACAAGLISLIGKETDDAFLGCVLSQINDRASVAKVADRFTMVYTPFHGTGYQEIPYVLRELGIRRLHCVPEQMVIDGTFPTVASPNPEEPASFAMAVALAEQVGADLILGSDPDADRVAIQVRGRDGRDGRYVQLTGNQTGVLLLDYLLGAKRRAGTLPADAVALKSLVTTDMARIVAERNGARCCDTFTGFKFMAARKNQIEAAGEGHVIFSFEESIGYMIGDYVRDKDAVTASLLLTEMAAWYAAQGMDLLEAMDALYRKYGWHGERTVSLVIPGLEGMAHRQAMMARLRSEPLTEIAGVAVTLRRDHLDGTEVDVATGAVRGTELVGADVLRYRLADGTDLLVRPSGTEPKIKIYILAKGPDRADCQEKTDRYAAWAQTLTERV